MNHPDDNVHRCTACGSWCYGTRPCATCALVTARIEARAMTG